MKITVYFDLFPGIDPDNVWFHNGAHTKALSSTRYRVVVNVNYPPADVDLEAVEAVVDEEEK